MATYATVSELKSALGITDNSKDTLLWIYLDGAEEAINRFLGVDTITDSAITERIKVDDVCNGSIILSKRPVTDVNKINGVAYSGVLGTDFIVENLRKVTFLDLTASLASLAFDSFEIEYQAGYASVPKDVKVATIMLASEMYASGGSNQAYDSYAIGDERVTFKKPEDQRAFETLLKPYRLFK